ncbi:MAG: glycerate kinase [Fidelibacterota bacterium]|nr:MAG: glycerate kinase [Candidatus Neomarinimicrobiota bacterium]
MQADTPRKLLVLTFEAAVEAAQPDRAVVEHLPPRPMGRVVVVGAGKAASRMALAVEDAWQETASGVVITPYGHIGEDGLRRIRVLEAGHPIPDQAGVEATREVLSTVKGLTSDDLVLCLISGGGSALLSLPHGISLGQKMELTKLLLKSGATIGELNTVRKHVSGVKGGRLAAAAQPAQVLSLIVSDVVGDDLSVIASGPTVPDPGTYADALAVLDRYDIDAPSVRAHLEAGVIGDVDESPKPGATIFRRVENRLIVTAAQALEAAAGVLRAQGFDTQAADDRIEGESQLVALDCAEQAKRLLSGQASLTGGETTVIVRGKGRGGPNLEFLLTLAMALRGEPGIYALAADTDGIDGTGDAAGAIVTPDTLERAALRGLEPQALLDNNDAYTFFSELGDLIKTGPTGTNVNDIRIIFRQQTAH